jgi:hypothetical protein
MKLKWKYRFDQYIDKLSPHTYYYNDLNNCIHFIDLRNR